MVDLKGGETSVSAGTAKSVSVGITNKTGVTMYDLTICVAAPGIGTTGKITGAELKSADGQTPTNWALTDLNGDPLGNDGATCVKLAMPQQNGHALSPNGTARLDVDIAGRGNNKRTLTLTPTVEQGRVVIGMAGDPADPGLGADAEDAEAGAAVFAAGQMPTVEDHMLSASLGRTFKVTRRAGRSV